jgi:translation initiation factor 1 (eIF-1/SUI1)
MLQDYNFEQINVNIEKPSALYYKVATATKTKVIQPTTVLNIKPTSDDLKNIAKELKNVFGDGFQISDVGSIVKLSLEYISSFYSISLQEKKEAIIQIINYIIDITDTPYLPDCIFDPIFKTLLDSLIEAIIPSSSSDPSKITIQGIFSNKVIDDYTKELKATFADGFQLKDIGTTINLSVKFVNQFTQTTLKEKKDAAKNIINKVIDDVDIPYIPDKYFDGILKDLTSGIVDSLIN